MKIYTKTGDRGDTGLFGGPRVAKDDRRIEAYGAVDELNAALGLARTESLPADLDEVLSQIQNDLFVVGAELATPDAARQATRVAADHVVRLESAIDRHDGQLPELRQFIVPGGTRAAALLHLARTICRRAERRLVTLRRDEPSVSEQLVIYLNRLSDLLFVLARSANAVAGVDDVPWTVG